LKRIPNGQGDGAGRARYSLKKAVMIRTDMPSYLSLLTDSPTTEELRRDIADEFNRQLLIHQGDYRTQHFVVSFSHHLPMEEIEKVLDRLEEIFSDPLRLHLFAVHQEEHGTAIHIVESADPEGRLRHLSRKEFFDLKKAVIKELQPFLNSREKEVARNFRKGIATQDWKHSVELKGDSWKDYIRRAVEKATKKLEEGEVEKAISILDRYGVEIREVKPGELSPTGKKTKRHNVYAVYREDGKTYSIRLNKKMRATFERYKTAFERARDELGRAKHGIEAVAESVRELEAGNSLYIQRTERDTGTEGTTTERERRADIGADLSKKLEKEYARLAKIEQELEEYREELERLESYARKPEQDISGRDRNSDIPSTAGAVESQVIYIGKGDGRVVISDRREILERLGAEEIEPVRNEEDIAKYWKNNRCKGYIEIYASSIPEWIHEGIGKAEWTETYIPKSMTIERTRKHKPTKVYAKQYFEIDGEIVLEKEIVQNPENYINIDGEIGKIAKEALRQREEIEMWWWQEKEKENDNDYGIDL